MINNIFTIDTEDWFHANYEDNLFTNSKEMQSTVCKNVETYLKHFRDHNVKATFFVLGFVAESHPDLVREIAAEEHEIASHGYGHKLVYKQTPEEFREDIRKSKEVLEEITGKKVLGYRAPSWSIVENSLWALDILEEEGFLYTSSIFPTRNFLYGIPYAPRFLHTHEIYGKKNLKLLEFPPSTISIGKINIPFSGGAYFRVLPYPVIKSFTQQLNRSGHPALFYLHPREIDPLQPRLKLPLRDRLIHYWGIRGCEKKLIQVINRFEFISIEQYLQEKNYDAEGK